MAELKLRRLNELNIRLKEDLERPRVKVSEAAMSWVSPLASARKPYQSGYASNFPHLSLGTTWLVQDMGRYIGLLLKFLASFPPFLQTHQLLQ